MSEEERKELLLKLDKVTAEVKVLSGSIRKTANELKKVAEAIGDDILSNIDRLPIGQYWRTADEWEPTSYDLPKLKTDFLKLRELLKEKADLEKKLGVTLK